jgi:hypothetical protein
MTRQETDKDMATNKRSDRKGEKKIAVDEKKITTAERKEVLHDLNSDGTAIEVAEAMIAIDPSKATKKVADKLLKEADESRQAI